MEVLISIIEYDLQQYIRNCHMCALYENYILDDDDEGLYKSDRTPHCLAKHDVDESGAIDPDFDRYIPRDCHAPSYQKLILIDSELRDAKTLKETRDIFMKKYINVISTLKKPE